LMVTNPSFYLVDAALPIGKGFLEFPDPLGRAPNSNAACEYWIEKFRDGGTELMESRPRKLIFPCHLAIRYQPARRRLRKI
jgi:hypothetical protein